MRNIETLLKLKEYRVLSYSQVPKTLLDELLEDDLVELRYVSTEEKQVVATEYFFYKYRDLNVNNSESIEREFRRAEENRTKKFSSQSGIFIAGNCKINDKEINIFQNSAIFLKDLPKIDKDILVVVVENFENLIYYKKQLYLFERESNILFIYKNRTMPKFIQTLKNKIFYFGDFDLAGVNAYLDEIMPLNCDVEFFIPETIERDIAEFGSKELYNIQINRYKNITSDVVEISNLLNIMKSNQKVLEQEFYIKD